MRDKETTQAVACLLMHHNAVAPEKHRAPMLAIAAQDDAKPPHQVASG